jgi:hypothetical protein
MAKPEFNMENLQKCVCNECPVQKNSECAQKGFKMMPQMMEEMKKGNMPNPKEVPGMYCASGTTMCEDLDYDKMCNCINCPVYAENNLSEGDPDSYFCKKGEAK